MNEHYLYLIINFGTILFPFLFSFERRVAYYTWWRYLFPAMCITAVVFLIWDHFFTIWQVWGFNDQYITGIKLGPLPLEEILFFVTVPYASIFIYAFINKFWPDAGLLDKWHKQISIGIILVAAVLMCLYYDKAYTALNCGYAIILLSLQVFWIKGNYMGRFYRFYLWHLIPFFLVNGILTGTGLAEPVVWYHQNEHIGLRLFTIPVEDTLYSMSLMLMNITLLEYFRSKHRSNA